MIPDVLLPNDFIWARFIAGFIIGAILGSFSGVLAYRLPRRLSIVFPRSHCLSCNTVLHACDLVPVFSWLALRGRCRHCGAKIGIHCIVLEVMTGFACALATAAIGFSASLIIAYAGIVIVAALSACVIQSGISKS